MYDLGRRAHAAPPIVTQQLPEQYNRSKCVLGFKLVKKCSHARGSLIYQSCMPTSRKPKLPMLHLTINYHPMFQRAPRLTNTCRTCLFTSLILSALLFFSHPLHLPPLFSPPPPAPFIFDDFTAVQDNNYTVVMSRGEPGGPAGDVRCHFAR